jgi:hypothetical protein
VVTDEESHASKSMPMIPLRNIAYFAGNTALRGGKSLLARPAARAYGGVMKVSVTCEAARATRSPVAAA